MTSEGAVRWRIFNPNDLLAWTFQPSIPDEVGVPVLHFFTRQVANDPDFGEVIAEHTRAELIPGTDVEAIWTFNPEKHYFEIIAPRVD